MKWWFGYYAGRLVVWKPVTFRRLCMKLLLLAFVFFGGVYFGMQADREGVFAGLVSFVDAFVKDIARSL